MLMEITGQQLIPQVQQTTWNAICDPAVLQLCIPGCDSMLQTSDSEFDLTMSAKVGPVSAKFKSKITLTNDLPQWNMRWGVTYRHEMYRQEFRYNEYRSGHFFPRLDVFVEYKPHPEWLIRVFGRNLTDAKNYSTRTTYAGGGIRGTVPVNYTEQKPLSFGPAIGINIQKTFGE